jgi:hypothetical protein
MHAFSRYLRPPVRQTRWLIITVVILLAGVTWLGMEAFHIHETAVRIRGQSDQLRRMQVSAQSRKPSADTLESQKHWASLKREREFPWPRIFQAIERLNNPEIELLEFLPDKQNRMIVLHGEARNRAAVVAYLEALAAQKTFGNVHLLHQQTVMRGQLETVAFEIKAGISE